MVGGKKGDTERENLGGKEGHVQEVEKEERGGEGKRMELLIMVVTYENDRWNRRKQRQLAEAEKRMTDSECGSRSSGIS